ncbi:TPA: hypothetical protein ACOECL_000455 [Stenotrophomonas maltophilia]|uniref:hypothetical protein n=1 Tax=Stenotrophomonas maltophilia TaxID=40324 RepID=UPI000DA87AF5|nr:hypothetical protein [Stenotrophomonas maltophilia]PZS70595.1 hypothetical protein A7X76_10305 [Stenotrophomonas maltophilia]
MNVIEKRARALLDTELRKLGLHEYAYHVGCGAGLDRNDQAAINAIAAALTPPEGYVLVPVELPVEMEVAFMESWVSKRRCIDDPEMQDAWDAALAVRPEVKP